MSTITPAAGGDAGAEPVAWRYRYVEPDNSYRGDWNYTASKPAPYTRYECQPLYAHPPASSPHDGVQEALERLKDKIDTRLNNNLCEMKEGYDDSIVGFNEAWDIVRKAFDAALSTLRATPTTGEEG